MKIAILKTGAPPPPLEARFGGYPEMFERLLAAPDFQFAALDVASGQWPPAVAAFDAYLVTGSAAGAYDDLPWIDPLKNFLRQARGRAALVGICFGHQIMAEAFGGQVIKSPKGWGLGLQSYQVATSAPWIDGPGPIRIPASHQDQVVVRPPGSTVVLASDFTPFAGLAYGDQSAISFQCHPEFEPDYARALIEIRRGKSLTDAQAAAALSSYDASDDRARLGGWIDSFLRQSAA